MPADERARLRNLGDVQVVAVAELGSLRLDLARVRRLRAGDVLVLDRLAGERVTIKVNGVPLAEGETILLGDTMAVRVTGMAPVPGVSADVW